MTLLATLGSSPLLDGRFPLPLDRPFTAAQARAAGLQQRELRRLVDASLLRRLLRGVYAVAQLPDTHAVRTQALALVAPAGSVVTDWSACWLWTGVHRPNAHLEDTPVSLFRESGAGRLRNPLASSGERLLSPSDLVPLTDRLLVTAPIRTAWDLGRFGSPVVALGGIDALLRHGSFSKDELLAGVERFRRQRGVVQLRWLAPMGDRRSESCGESGLRFHWRQCPELPPPELQIPVLRSDGTELFRVDLGVEELRFGAEYDGERWHNASTAHGDAVRRGRLDEEFRWLIEVFRRVNVYGTAVDATTRLRNGIHEARRRTGNRPRFD
jgi:hypothetical protein